MYIMQFPGNDNDLKEALGRKANEFLSLSESKLTKDLPLNQAYIFLYLKYFGLEDLIMKKMNSFISSGKNAWDGQTWDMSSVENLISYFSSTGKGMSQNFYSLFRSGFNADDDIRIYIGLQVMKNIGFDDPDLHYWLNRTYSRKSTLTIITSRYVNGIRQPGQIKKPVVFSDEVTEVRREINGKSEIAFEKLLNEALQSSSNSGNYIIQRISALEVVNKEVSEMSGQYTNAYISDSVAKWEQRNKNLDNWKIIQIIVFSILCLIVLIKGIKKEKISIIITEQIISVSIGVFLSFIINIIIAGYI